MEAEIALRNMTYKLIIDSGIHQLTLQNLKLALKLLEKEQDVNVSLIQSQIMDGLIRFARKERQLLRLFRNVKADYFENPRYIEVPTFIKAILSNIIREIIMFQLRQRESGQSESMLLGVPDMPFYPYHAFSIPPMLRQMSAPNPISHLRLPTQQKLFNQIGNGMFNMFLPNVPLMNYGHFPFMNFFPSMSPEQLRLILNMGEQEQRKKQMNYRHTQEDIRPSVQEGCENDHRNAHISSLSNKEIKLESSDDVFMINRQVKVSKNRLSAQQSVPVKPKKKFLKLNKGKEVSEIEIQTDMTLIRQGIKLVRHRTHKILKKSQIIRQRLHFEKMKKCFEQRKQIQIIEGQNQFENVGLNFDVPCSKPLKDPLNNTFCENRQPQIKMIEQQKQDKVMGDQDHLEEKKNSNSDHCQQEGIEHPIASMKISTPSEENKIMAPAINFFEQEFIEDGRFIDSNSFHCSEKISHFEEMQKCLLSFEKEKKGEVCRQMEPIQHVSVEKIEKNKFEKCPCFGVVSSQIIFQCSVCKSSFHLECIDRIEKNSMFSQVQCPVCMIRGVECFESVKEVIKQCYFRDISQQSFSINVDLLPYVSLGEQYPLIKNKEERLKDIQIRCFRIEQSYEKTEITWPDEAAITVRGKPLTETYGLHINSSQRKRKDAPLVITKQALTYELNQDIPDFKSTKIQISPKKLAADQKARKRIDNNHTYLFGVYLIERIRPEKLYKQIVENELKAQELNYINNLFMVDAQEDQLSIDFIFCSLLDPYSWKLMEMPVRGVNCRHAQCFDLKSHVYFTWVSKNKTWRCPVCCLEARRFKVDREQIDMIEKVKGSYFPQRVIFLREGRVIFQVDELRKLWVEIQREEREGNQKKEDKQEEGKGTTRLKSYKFYQYVPFLELVQIQITPQLYWDKPKRVPNKKKSQLCNSKAVRTAKGKGGKKSGV